MAYREHSKHAIEPEAAMTIRKVTMALIAFVLAAGVGFHQHENV